MHALFAGRRQGGYFFHFLYGNALKCIIDEEGISYRSDKKEREMRNIRACDRAQQDPSKGLCRQPGCVRSGGIKHALIPSKRFLFLFYIFPEKHDDLRRTGIRRMLE